MKSTPFSRGLELAKLATRVGLKELKSGDIKSRYEQAVLMAKSFSNLKGAAMKMGQLLSLDLDNYFPPEAIEVLSQLQNAAIAHPFDEIEAILQKEILPKDRQNLSDISPSPIGVASIGQVHRAKYKGEDIVLKVQYPGVAESIDSDLKILKNIATSFCVLSGRKMNLDPLFQEFQNILQQETNYLTEAIFQKQFQEKVAQLNATSDFQFRVPKVIDELSTERVLASHFEPGVTLRTWINSKPSKKAREKVAVAILDLYFHEFFEWGLVQTDPNFGNFLVRTENSEPSICLLDFGASRSYSREFIQNYMALLNYGSKGESENLKQHAIEFGLIDKRESAAAFKAFNEMFMTAIKPFFIKNSSESQFFDFTDRQHLLESQETVKKMSQELVYSPPPYALIFLHRKLGGVYSVLKSLEVKLDISPYWKMMSDLSARKA